MSRQRMIAIGSLIVVVGVAVVAGAAGAFGPGTPGITYLTAVAAIRDVRASVAVTGSIHPVDDFALAFGADPQRVTTTSAGSGSAGSVGSGSSGSGATAGAGRTWTVRTVSVAAGDTVQAGQVLAAADTADAEQALAIAQANLAAAQARLAADQAAPTANSRDRAKLAVTQAQQALAQANDALAQAKAAGALAVSQAHDVLTAAQAALAADTMASKAASVIAADQAAVAQASRTLDTVKLQAKGSTTQAQRAVDAAKLAVTSATLAYQGVIGADTSALVAADQATVLQAQASVTSSQKTLDQAVIRAPIVGIVSAVSARVGESASGTVVRLRSAALEVTASVTQGDLPKLMVGQPVDVTVDPLGATAAGSVQSIDLSTAATSASGVVSYSVVIALPQAPDQTAPAMTVHVVVTTQMDAGVLAVPATALAGGPGAYTVEVLDASGSPRTVTVGVGLITEEWVEITSGLAAGDTVVTGTVSAKDQVQQFPTGPATSRPSSTP